MKRSASIADQFVVEANVAVNAVVAAAVVAVAVVVAAAAAVVAVADVIAATMGVVQGNWVADVVVHSYELGMYLLLVVVVVVVQVVLVVVAVVVDHEIETGQIVSVVEFLTAAVLRPVFAAEVLVLLKPVSVLDDDDVSKTVVVPAMVKISRHHHHFRH